MATSIMLIDGSVSNRKKVAAWLRPTRNRLLFAKNSQIAMQMLFREQPRLILFSTKLPDLSLKRLIRVIRARAPLARLIAIISATGNGIEYDPEFIQQITNFLFEPLCHEELLFSISRDLRLQQLNCENYYLKEELAFSALAQHWHP